MIEVRCPECGKFFEIDGARAGHLVSCPACRARFLAAPPRPAREIIDVEAEVVGSEDIAPPPPPPPDERAPQVWPPETPPYEQRVYTWSMERRYGGPGCCTVGCLLLIVLLALAVQGFFSLFW